MVKPLLISLAVAALSLAGADTFRISLTQPSIVKGNQLKAGDYNLDVQKDSVVIAQGKHRLEVPATIESTGKKYGRTQILFNESNGKLSIRQIELGGTSTRVVFDSAVAQ